MGDRKSAFVANVSHEFKNPLGIISGAMAYILDGLSGDIKEEERDILKMAKKKRRAADQISDGPPGYCKDRSGEDGVVKRTDRYDLAD